MANSETEDHWGTTVTTVWVCSEPRKYPAGQKNATQHNINWNRVTHVQLKFNFKELRNTFQIGQIN